MEQPATRPLSRWDKAGITIFLLLLLAFGVHVEQKSAFLSRRMGDLDVFLRAAWAVRNDADLYAITNDNDWHYLYPPLYAILLRPLADPPPGADTTGYVSYPVSVAIMFVVNVICLFLAAHVLAGVIERHAGWRAQPKYCRRWWALRLWPILVCILPIGHTLMRAQVNIIVLAILCAALAAWMRQHNLRAGLWLSLAICIKVIPAYLLIYPLWRRDGRTFMGCGIGCFAGLVVIPLLTFGPTRFVTHYENYAHAFFGPWLLNTADERSREELATTDSIGVKNALHNWMYRGPERTTTEMHIAAKVAYVLLGLAMTFVTLWPVGRIADPSKRQDPTQIACLILLMAIFSPVCHMHYLLFCLPAVACLFMRSWQAAPRIRVPGMLTGCFLVFNITMAIAYWPDLEFIRDLCVALFATLPLWVIPVVQLWCDGSKPAVETHQILAARVVVLPMTESVSYADDSMCVSSETGP